MSDTKRVIVVGAGGVGGWLARGISMMLEWRLPGSALVIVDGDSYEPKNKERQAFQALGNKAIVLASELSKLYDRTIIIPQPFWVVSDTAQGNTEDNQENNIGDKIVAKDLLEEGDIVFAVVDNFKARKDLFDAAKEFKNIDVFTGGNDDDLYGSIYHYQRREGEEVTMHPAEMADEYINPPDRNPGEMSCQERAELKGGTQLVATNMAVASWLLSRVQKAIFENEEPAMSEVYFDMGVGLAQGYDRRINVTENETVLA
jgi:hypothetical protein